MTAFHKDVMTKLSAANSNPQLEGSIAKLTHAVGAIISFVSQNPAKLELAARDFAFSLARTYMGKDYFTPFVLAGAVPKLHFKFIWCQQTLSLHFTICIWLVFLLLCCVMSQVQECHEIAYHF